MILAARLAIVSILVNRSLVAQTPTPTGVVTGTVRDETGRPVREALVVLDAETTPMRARTSIEGRFRIDRVPVGGHELQVVRIGFRPHRSRISVTESGISVDVTIDPAPMLLDTIAVRVARSGIYGSVSTRGIALLPHEPRPLPGAIIEVLNMPFRTTTGADGRFSMTDVGEGAYSLLVRLDRYQSTIVPVYVPADGGVDLNVVLDSTIADWQRRQDLEFRDISRRLREASNPSAFVSAAELTFPTGTSLKNALRETPSNLNQGLLVQDDVTCIYVDGEPRPGMTAGDFLTEDVHAVELYGIDVRGRTQAPIAAWPRGTFCGTGRKEGPGDAVRERQPGEARRRPGTTNIASVAVIWTRHRR